LVRKRTSRYANALDINDSIGLGKNNILFVSKKVIACSLGDFLTQLQKFEEGFRYLDKAIELDSSYPNPYMTKGLGLAQIGRVDEGIKFLEKAKYLGILQAESIINMLKGNL
jgi:tetratricopeptide (TPR) repeat protein